MAAARQQRVVAMRHGDWLDHAELMWPANKPRPWDPPLTDAGILRAWTAGKRLRAQAAADGYVLHRVPLDVSRVKVSKEYGLSEMMNGEAMGVIVSQVAPDVEKWFLDLAELEAILPAGTIDHSTEPLYPEEPKWGASVRGARIRYSSVIKALADKYPDENLLLVTHGEAVGSSAACFGTGMEVYDVECAVLCSRKEAASGLRG